VIIVKEGYKSELDLLETEIAIKYIKDNFERDFAEKMNLIRVSAPLFVRSKLNLNDHLNGHERVILFDIPAIGEDAEIVQSLAKWKRVSLKSHNIKPDHGIYTDMNAIRRDEDLDNLHSIYVDQWDWEMVITNEQRTYETLKEVVEKIYSVLLYTENKISQKYSYIKKELPNEIFFISTNELEKKYPNLSRKERENAICKEKKAVFLYQIGWPLEDGLSHDGRAADYDDWNLNGDILLWYDVLDRAVEISSMGIRVNKDSLLKQLKHKKEEHKLNTPYCQQIINDEVPLSIGGGLGQSRICMYFLRKMHIGEVQSSLWSEEELLKLKELGIEIL